EELAALAFSSSVYFLVVSIFIGLSIGVSAVVAKSVGAGLFEQAKLQTMVALLMVLGLSVTLGAVGFATIRPAFTILGAGPEIVPLIES
ncbi:MAG: Na+-driven multidrug efflux pump, partial [Paracoccaceae bacterium]